MDTGRTAAAERLTIIVSNDGLNAWIECRQADRGGAPPTMDDIVAVLEVSKISLTPTVQKRIEEYVQLWKPSDAGGAREVPSKYLIAKATPPVQPQDETLELEEQFRETPTDGRIVGTIDYFARSSIKTVTVGTMIGHVTPAQPGAPGRDVFGREIPAPGKTTAQVSFGYGLTLTETGAVRAEAAGRLLMENNRLRIEPGLEIRGDVDFDTGSLDVCVDVDVHGTVKSNFRVHTTGSLSVGRAIEAAEIDVDGSLRVQGGICGREGAGGIRVGGGITARFCNESNVQAGADIRIEAETLNSHVHTPALFRSPSGTIIGGTVWAREGIEVAVLGSDSAVTTVVAVGVPLTALREQRQIDDNINGQTKLAAGIREKIAPLTANLKRLTPHQREAATELMSRANELDMAVEDLQQRRQALLESSQPRGTPHILVNQAAYRGVRIAIGARETRLDNVLHGPVRIEERKVDGATEIVAVHQRTGSVTVLPSWEIDLSATAPERPTATDAKA